MDSPLALFGFLSIFHVIGAVALAKGCAGYGTGCTKRREASAMRFSLWSGERCSAACPLLLAWIWRLMPREGRLLSIGSSHRLGPLVPDSSAILG